MTSGPWAPALAAACLLAGCAWAAPADSSRPSATPAGTPSAGPVLFEDSLASDTGRGWPTGGVANAVYTFGQGYQVAVGRGDIVVSVHPSLSGLKPSQLRDVSVSVTAQRSPSVGPDTRYGVFCRLDPTPEGSAGHTGHAYRFEIAVDNSRTGSRYGLRWFITLDADRPGDVRTIAQGVATTDQSQVQTIRGDCVTEPAGGTRLTLRLGSTWLGEASDSTITEAGWPGISVISATSDRPRLTFTDFSLRSASA